MKIILSPAKTLNTNCEESTSNKALLFHDESLQLFQKLKKLSKSSLKEAMNLSDKLVNEVYTLYKTFSEDKPKYPAIELYNGLAFRQLHINAYNQDQIDYLEKHLRILSGMYGVLTPYTPIWPYRLDFVMHFKRIHLKKFWNTKISDVFMNEEWLLNLASEEFSTLIDHPHMHTIYFYDEKNGKRRVNSAEAKKARGQTLEWCVLNQIQTISQIKNLKLLSYTLDSHTMSQTTFVRYLD